MEGAALQQGKLVVICGPTATGKSGLAVAIAQRLMKKSSVQDFAIQPPVIRCAPNLDVLSSAHDTPIHGTSTDSASTHNASTHSAILSADSRQVYREFDIGTAKPDCSDQAVVPHHLIDICEPTKTLTLGEFQVQAQTLITQMHQQQVLPLLVGGTGLYIKSVVRGMRIPRVPPQPELRLQLERLGQRYNYAQLVAIDAAAAQKIHRNDRVRTQRALEVFYATGQTISSQQGEAPPDYPILQIGLDCLEPQAQPSQLSQKRAKDHRDDRLTQRIRRRSHLMVQQGFVEEVHGLCERYGPNLPLLNTLGYAEMRRHLRGDIDLEEAIDLTVLHTRQFAKRQRTWFRAVPEIEWFDSDQPDLVEQVWARIRAFI